MKRFAKSASAIALAGAMTLGAAPAATAVPASEARLVEGKYYHEACVQLYEEALKAEGKSLRDTSIEAKVGGIICEPVTIDVVEGDDTDAGYGLGPALSAAAVLGLGAAALSSGANGSSEKPAEQPAPAPAPEAPKGPEKGVKPGAEKGVKPAAPAAQAPAKRGMLAQTGANSVAPVAIMFALTIAGAAAFILRRKSA
ncbi:LPXTG cell wall anchor domain-containing protein [Corynebacterium hindlerae]|uniref:LPXTG cell wall anchor domain-containing protein n=1 Tax=Corynebacterium hindlerae TaxID=699041 RepID=UPI0031B68802